MAEYYDKSKTFGSLGQKIQTAVLNNRLSFVAILNLRFSYRSLLPVVCSSICHFCTVYMYKSSEL